MSQLRVSLVRCCVALTALLAIGVESANAEIDFYKDVYPILKANCISCHNKKTAESSLNLESPESIRTGGDSGAGVVPGKALESLIYLASTHEGDSVMPPKNNKVGAVDLTPAELKILASWIDLGAKDSVQQMQKLNWRPIPAGVHPIYSVEVTADGRWAATGRTNQVAIYDLATRQFESILADKALESRPNSPPGGRTHIGFVQSLAFSPDGKRLASGSFREVKIWKQQQSDLVTFKTPQLADLVATTLTPNGQFQINVDSKGDLHLVDLQSGSVVRKISAGAVQATTLAVSPDSKIVALGAPDNVIGFWNLETGERVLGITSPSPIQAIAWGADSKAIVAAGEDKIIRVWQLPEGQPEAGVPVELKGATSKVTAVISAINPTRVIAATDDSQFHIWDLSKGQLIQSHKIPAVTTFAITKDGATLIAGCVDGAVRIWDLKAGKQTSELKGDAKSVREVAEINWQVATLTLELDYQKKEVARLTAANKSLDEVVKKSKETIETVNKVLPERKKAHTTADAAKTAAQKPVDDLKAKIAALPEGQKDAELEKQLKAAEDALTKAATGESTALKDLRTSETHVNDATNEVEIATAAQAKNVELLNAANTATTTAQTGLDKAKADLAAKQKTISERKMHPVAVAISVDSQTVSAIFNNGEERIWAVASATPILTVDGTKECLRASIVSIAPGQFITSLPDGTASLQETKARWILERTLGDENSTIFADQVNSLRFSPDGKSLAVGGGEPSRSGEISIWDIESGNLITEWKDRHADTVICLDFSPDGKLLASGSTDKLVKVSDIASGKQINLFEGHTHHAMGVSFRADGRILASSGADEAVLIWDMQIGERVRKIAGWTKEVTAAKFMGASINVVTAAGDKQIRVVNDQGGQVRTIGNLPNFMHAVACTSDGTIIVAGGEDGVLRVWNAADGKELATFSN
ncbi:c-type cytochrome domain-containing protein [Planctomicrobium sp. SH527]|uniref:c-type cytochrome domain-containing protein n=1 Tax=Planctomicrobium sp. SH527 TaxID=3448123 RepID=UPI003F5C8800